jgi:microcompartment protein CcmK/EutM
LLLARVVGDVVSTQKNKELSGWKLMLVENVDLNGKADGDTFIAVDKAQAGIDDLVLINKEGSGARLLLDNEQIPVQAVIVGIVDGYDLSEEHDD